MWPLDIDLICRLKGPFIPLNFVINYCHIDPQIKRMERGNPTNVLNELKYIFMLSNYILLILERLDRGVSKSAPIYYSQLY